MPRQGPCLLPEGIEREEEVSGLTSGRIGSQAAQAAPTIAGPEPRGGRVGRELGWADGRDSGKPLLSLPEEGEAKAQSPSHPYTLPRAQDPGPVSKNLRAEITRH